MKMQRLYIASYRFFVTLLTITSVHGIQRFREQPIGGIVRAGQQHTLRCSVEDLKGQVQWLRKGFGFGPGPEFDGYPRYRIIHEDTGDYHLNISDIQLEDDAEFECQVGATEDTGGLKSSLAKLTVQVPPDVVSIDGAPRIDVTSGQSVDLICRATNGRPAPVITWERAGLPVIDGVGNETIVKEDGKRTDVTSRLTILLTRADQGIQFVCRATSPAMDSEMTSSVTLEVQYKAEISMIVSPNEETFKEFASVSFECKANAHPANISWRWYIGINLIPGRFSDRLDLRNVNRELHNRKVICEATNSVGSSRNEFHLRIEYGPRFVSGAENLSADPGDAVELSCNVDSNPEAKVIWHRVGSAEILGRESILRIPSVMEEHFAAFTCTASVRGHKDITREVHIRRKGPPRITSEGSQSAEYGETGTLECYVEGSPKPTVITWTKNGKELHFNIHGRYRIRNEDDANGRRSVIEIAEVKDEDFAEYLCSAHNSYGQDQLTIKYSKKESLPLAYILGGAVGGFVLIVVICVITVVIWKHRKSRESDSSSSRSSEDSNSVKKANNVPNIKVEYSTQSTVDGWRESLPEEQFPQYSAEYDELRYPPKDSTYSGLTNGFIDPFNEYEINSITRSPYFHPNHFDNVYGTYPRGMANTYAPRMEASSYGPLYGSETYATYGRPMRRNFSPVTVAPVYPQHPLHASPTDSKLSTNV